MKRDLSRASSTDGPEVASTAAVERAEALVRALAGVSDVAVEMAGLQVRSVQVVPVPNAAPRGITRNVQSALLAGLGLSIDSRVVRIVPALTRAGPAKNTAATPAPAAPTPARVNGPAAPIPTRTRAPRIEALELNRFNPDLLECRVVVEHAGRRQTGIAQAGDEREGAVTLAARATLDALRGMATGDWLFEGAADVIIGGQRHVCVSVRKHEAGTSLSGAAPVHESVEQAVASAVLNAAGLDSAADPENQRLVRQR